MLDRRLAHYGPESADARAELRRSINRQIELLWSENGSSKAGAQFATPDGQPVVDKIYELSPKDDRQRAAQSQALGLAVQMGQTRLLMLEQRSDPVPMLLLVVLILWLIFLFISFGLFAPSNYTVVVSLFVAAAAVCGAVFLIVEMYYPYGGLIQAHPRCYAQPSRSLDLRKRSTPDSCRWTILPSLKLINNRAVSFSCVRGTKVLGDDSAS